MEQQAGATQLCLNEESAALLPGSHKVQDVRVRTQALVIPSFPDTAVPLVVTPEALSRAFDCVLAAISVALHLEEKKKVVKIQKLYLLFQYLYNVIRSEVNKEKKI